MLSKKDFDVAPFLDTLKQDALIKSCNGVLSSMDYPGSLLASIIAHEHTLFGPHPYTVLLSQHKYYCRMVQKEYLEEATARFEIFHPANVATINFMFPTFVKPIKSSFSSNALPIFSLEDLNQKLPHLIMKDNFYKIFDVALKHYTHLEYDSSHFIAEELLEGIQCTLEGYVFNNEVGIIGITDSIMYEGTICFKRFEYPSKLPPEVQMSMHEYAKKLIAALTLNTTMFNIEFMYNQKEQYIKIIEINTRMVSQFADLYEKVDGLNGYEPALEIAAGQKPTMLKRAGEYSVAASCVLRLFKDQKVLHVPDEKDFERVKSICKAARIEVYATVGQNLSYHDQDGKSFRYCVINLGAHSWQELYEKEEFCKRHLNFKFADI